jgi:hypothetical protein
VRTLFSTFHSQGILFKHTRDFNGEGELHAVLKKQWEKAMEVVEMFATGVKTSNPDLEADRKIRDTYAEGNVDPFNKTNGKVAYEHRLWYGVFIVGRYWFLCGCKEVAFLKWTQIIFDNATENGTPVQYIKIIHHFDKGHQLSITNTTARSNTDVSHRIYINENDPLCPIKSFIFFRSLCCLEQDRVFCKPYNSKQMKK